MILDNGNFRRDTNPAATSRGQVYQLDEQAKTATLVLNADLGRYSLAVGSDRKAVERQLLVRRGVPARRLRYQRRSGFQRLKSVFSVRTAAPVYRSYRLADMYSPVRGSR